MAVSFLTATRRRETVFLKEDIFSLLTFLEPGTIGAGTVPTGLVTAGAGLGEGAGFCALMASSLVILPSFPDPATAAGEIPFSAKILEAAGEACPDA